MVRLAMVLAALVMVASPAAAVDLTGRFHAEVSTAIVPGGVLPCTFDFTQASGTLTATVTCSILPPVTLTGTINSLVGFFNISGTIPVLCPTLAVTGLGAGNSYTFAGLLSCTGGPLPLVGNVSGSRCANGQLDPGETCEDGNWTNGDCCSSTCQQAPPGAACTTDDNTCTTDACDAGGACAHVANSIACDDGNGCTNGDTCGGGSCHGAFVTSGSACDDGNPCTPADTCDGAGACIPAGTLDCGACRTCVVGSGCSAVGQALDTCVGPVVPKAALQMKNHPLDDKDTADWRLPNGGASAVADFGDPRTTTGYELCVFGQSGLAGYDTRVLGVNVPTGAGWVATATGFKFKSKTGAARSITLRAGPAGKTKVVVKTKGADLDLPPLPLDLTRPVLVQLQAANGRCWQAEYANARTNTPIKFKSKTGSASGAFVD